MKAAMAAQNSVDAVSRIVVLVGNRAPVPISIRQAQKRVRSLIARLSRLASTLPPQFLGRTGLRICLCP